MSTQNNWSRRPYRVVSSRPETPVIRALVLAPLQGALAFQAGQYLLLCDPDEQLPQRSYSMANAPRPDGRISLLVTRMPGGPTSGWAHALQAGDGVLLEGPFGRFTAPADMQAPVLLLGAGAGLAPLRALAQALLQAQPQRRVSLLFSCRSREHRISPEELEQWQGRYPRFRYHETRTREADAPLHQRVPVLLPTLMPDLTGWEVFVCGPTGFVVDSDAAARTLGAADTALHTEEFFADPQPWLGPMPGIARAASLNEENT